MIVDTSALLEFLLRTSRGTRVEARLFRDEDELHAPISWTSRSLEAAEASCGRASPVRPCWRDRRSAAGGTRAALAVADRANNAEVLERDGQWTVQGDPTEGALLVAAHKAGLRSETLDERLPRVGEVPFSSERKLMSTVHRDARQQDRGIAFTKGAPDVLLARCNRELVGDQRRPLTAARRAEILQANEALAGQALRTLGVAGRWLTTEAFAEHQAHPDERLEQDLVFAGLVGMIDPPRPEAKEAVARARRAGIRPLMISGDTRAPLRSSRRSLASRRTGAPSPAPNSRSSPRSPAHEPSPMCPSTREPRTQTAHHRRTPSHGSHRRHDG